MMEKHHGWVAQGVAEVVDDMMEKMEVPPNQRKAVKIAIRVSALVIAKVLDQKK